jgi:rubrerythrin
LVSSIDFSSGSEYIKHKNERTVCIRFYDINLIRKSWSNYFEATCLSWEKIDENTLNKIKKQKEYEELTAKSLTPVYQAALNPLVKTLLHGLILDTTKHAETYQMIIDLNTRAAMGEESKNLGKKEIAKHLKEEAFMLKQTQDISEIVKDKSIKQIILNIVEDEKRHHKILTELLGMLEKESKEWDAYIYDLIEGFP